MENRVLVLSSQPAFAKLLQTALLESGTYDVISEQPGQFAENLELTRPFGLLVLDIDLDHEEQISSVLRFQKSNPETRTILLVTTPRDPSKDLGEIRIDRFIHKPFFLPNFLEEVANCIKDIHASEVDPIVDSPAGEKLGQHDLQSLVDLALDWTNARAIYYFKDGNLLAKASDLNELVLVDIHAYLASRSNLPLHADLVKYQQFIGDEQRSLIYFKILSERRMLVMVFDGERNIYEVKQLVNGVRKILLNDSKLPQTSDREQQSMDASIATHQPNPPQGDNSPFVEQGSTELPIDSEAKMDPDIGDTHPVESIDKDEFVSDSPGWISGEGNPMIANEVFAQKGMEVPSSDHLSEEQELKIEMAAPDSPESPQIVPSMDSPGEYSHEVQTIDQILSADSDHRTTEDLLKDLVFPWDESPVKDEEPVDFLSADERAWMSEMDDLGLEVETPDEDNLPSPLEVDQPTLIADHDQQTEPESDGSRETESAHPGSDNDVVEHVVETQSGLAQGISVPSTDEKFVLQPVSATRVSLNYTYLLIPRFRDQYLVGSLSHSLAQKMQEICIGYGWRLDRLAIRPTYLLCSIVAPPKIAPSRLIRKLRKASSDFIFECKPEWKDINPSLDFWAPGYLLTGGYLAPTELMIAEFISETRQMQGKQAT